MIMPSKNKDIGIIIINSSIMTSKDNRLCDIIKIGVVNNCSREIESASIMWITMKIFETNFSAAMSLQPLST